MSLDFKAQDGERIYAIGDCHGQADLFERLLGQIRLDEACRPVKTTKIIVLGDVIDRGPHSASLVERLMKYTYASDRFIVLMGNHEQIMLAALEGDREALQAWMKLGGAESLLSWGVAANLVTAGGATLLEEARTKIPAPVLRWMGALPLWHQSGEVLFVHAGIRPGVPLQEQDPRDLLWIRKKFLECKKRHPFLVVHGHSVSEGGPDVQPNRIGIDTGAFNTGKLTAIGVEGGARWFVNT